MAVIHQRHQSDRKQAGMVSIMVTMIMMLVISLIVLGFAQISHREQRQTLDRQLSAQAYFAAESGINDARDTIRKAQAQGLPIPEKPSCATSTAGPDYKYDPKIDPAHNVSYSCLLVSTKLQNLSINPVTAGDDSINIPLEPGSGVIDRLHLEWTSPAITTSNPTQVNKCDPNAGRFPKTGAGGWVCPYGVLRMDIVPTNALDRTALAAGQKTIFFYPTKGGPAATINYTASNGAVAAMQCPVAGISCTIDVTNMVASGSTTYALRISGLYADGALDITAFQGSTQLELRNAQIMVDATGKAQDVLRRVQVRLAMGKSGKTPDFAVESASSICKRYSIDNDLFNIPSDIIDQDQKNPMCLPMDIHPCVIIPKDIAMVIDTSQSMGYDWEPPLIRIQKMRQVVRDFLPDINITAAENHAAVIEFDQSARVVEPFIFDVPVLQTAIDGLRPAAGLGTNMSGGLTEAQKLFAVPPARPTSKKVIVYISDGLPYPRSDGPIALGIANQMKNVEGVEIYSIAILPKDFDPADVNYTKGIATDPTVHYAIADRPLDLDAALASIAARITTCN